MDTDDRFEALRGEADLYRQLIDAIDDYAIYMLDPDGGVVSWNAGARRIKGYEAAEIIGQSFERFYTEADRAVGLPQRALETARRDGRFENEGWRVRKDNTHFWAHVIIEPVISDGGILAGYAKVTRDLTERRNAQVALEQAREDLLQAQKMEAIGQLTGGVAHDFNNLLTAILSSLELVRKHLPDDPKVKRLIDNAVQGAQRGATLTQRMLAYARRQSLKTEAVDVPRLVESMAELIRPSLGAQIGIVTDFPDGLLPAVADHTQLETAIINLCLNARDAMPDGGIISVSARNETVPPGNRQGLGPGTYICIAITDAGEGMDEETIARATEPFFTTKGVGKGSGLGLPMVHGLAAQSGGRLQLMSRKGEGTTAELWLPADAAVAIPAKPVQVDAAPSPERQLVVLAVDDDALVLMNTAMMLEELGHKVHEATDGRSALEVLQSGEAVDLVISDHAMPGMTGSQLAHKIRDTWPRMPIILATGYAELPPGAAKDLPRLSKPFSQSDLAKAVAAAVLR